MKQCSIMYKFKIINGIKDEHNFLKNVTKEVTLEDDIKDN